MIRCTRFQSILFYSNWGPCARRTTITVHTPQCDGPFLSVCTIYFIFFPFIIHQTSCVYRIRESIVTTHGNGMCHATDVFRLVYACSRALYFLSCASVPTLMLLSTYPCSRYVQRHEECRHLLHCRHWRLNDKPNRGVRFTDFGEKIYTLLRPSWIL